MTDNEIRIAIAEKCGLFTAGELYDISLCIGWSVAMSDGKDEPSVERRKTSMRALNAMRRVLGPQYHTFLMKAKKLKV